MDVHGCSEKTLRFNFEAFFILHKKATPCVSEIGHAFYHKSAAHVSSILEYYRKLGFPSN